MCAGCWVDVLCVGVKKWQISGMGKPEILHTSKLPHAQKKRQNNLFTWGPQHGQMESEIYKYFVNIFIT